MLFAGFRFAVEADSHQSKSREERLELLVQFESESSSEDEVIDSTLKDLDGK